MRRLAGHPGARGAPVWATARSVAGASAELLPPLAALQLRVLVGDVGDAQRVVLQLVSIELLDGSEAEASLESEACLWLMIVINVSFNAIKIKVHIDNRILFLKMM